MRRTVRRMVASACSAGAVLAMCAAVTAPAGTPLPEAATAAAASCTPPPDVVPFQLVVGTVACQELRDSAGLLGAGVAVPFEYYVPPACAAAPPCPVLYLLHGFGGSFTEMLGAPGTTSSAWIQAETREPPPGFEQAPWDYADPATWRAAPTALDMILVAPLGQTLPGGDGPQPGMDSYWTDWNPRYAAGGSDQRYGTPPPRFETFLTAELPAFVEQHLPTASGRSWRAIGGVSLGGYGAYKLGLQHPDLYAAMLSVSGAQNFLFAPAPQPGMTTLPVGVQPPEPVTYVRLPAPSGAVVGAPLPSQVGTFTTALDAFGDPVADQAYFRGNMPTDLAMNGRAVAAGGTQLLGIDGFVNDMVPEQAATGDPAALGNDVGSEPFENIVFPMNLDMEAAFAAQDVANTFAVHQGNHSDTYRNAWFRGLEEFADARLAPAGALDAGGAPPARFDYRSIATDFSIWGWHLQVHRAQVEFLNLRDVTCRSITLQGSGRVTVTVPASCGTGVGGSATFEVDLGPDQLTDEPLGLSATPVYGRTVTVSLTS